MFGYIQFKLKIWFKYLNNRVKNYEMYQEEELVLKKELLKQGRLYILKMMIFLNSILNLGKVDITTSGYNIYIKYSYEGIRDFSN